jgi:2-iminobutanoate/2-iminopropanoate deaminase
MAFEAVNITDGTLDVNPRPFSSATKAMGLIFVSGQASVEGGKIINDSFENQFYRTMKNVELVLAQAGATLKDVCQVRAYVHDPKNSPLYNKLYREYFAQPFPARTTLLNCLNDELAFEMDVVAVDPNWKK